ncbi:A/G-specific adenine glycosylase [Clostridiales Family XIII bacterium PM5-7]
MKNLDQNFTKSLTRWYAENHRDLPWRKDKDPYHVWVSEIMLQQTRVEAVRDYYHRFMQALPTIEALAQADEETLLKLWQGLGYYNRVRNMHKAAVTVTTELDGQFPRDYESIKTLSGIGEYTAGAIASICFDQREPAVDGNVLRVMSRIQEDYADIKEAATKKRVRETLAALYPDQNCGDFTQGLIELGALICVPKGRPKCELCPVSGYCKAMTNGTQLALPVISQKKPRKEVEKTVFVLRSGDKTAVVKRGNKGLLAGTYEFPNIDMPLSTDEAIRTVENWGCHPIDIKRQVEEKHIFTHIQWNMTAYYFTCKDQSSDFLWVTGEELERDIPMATAFGKFKE